MGHKSKPPHWPDNGLEYIVSQTYHSSLPHELRILIRGTAPSPPKDTSLVVIRRISDQSHPAFGQHGLFAAKKIGSSAHILDYIGEVHADERPESDYDLSILRTRDGADIGVDASKKGNEARFINDFRGVRDRPNAFFREARGSPSGELRMSIWSGREFIKKGEEIVVSYGKSWWKARSSRDD